MSTMTRALIGREAELAPVEGLFDAPASLPRTVVLHRPAGKAARTSVSQPAPRPTTPGATPTNLGSAVNTGAAETRPSLSKDGTQLLFGRAPGSEGMSDIYLTTR